ncbi:MAG: gamma-glutamylcyclotransferase [Armatimonadetes bacterium]|nr:gamma-glutamylcyclotransferase [Armatimonadota bacterium]
MLHLFVYGSLKQGHCNYHQVERWVVDSRPAHVEGRLYLRPDGYPVLWIPSSERALPGSGDARADLRAQVQPLPHPEPVTGAEWVPGELLRLEGKPEVLTRLDHFEGYRFGAGASEYRRVLLPARLSSGLVRAWTYVCSETQEQAGMFGWKLIDQWPPPGSSPPPPYTGGCSP